MKEILDIVAWPSCVVVCVLIIGLMFRKQIASLLDRADEVTKDGIKTRKPNPAKSATTDVEKSSIGLRLFLTTPLSGIGNQQQYSAFMDRMKPLLTRIRSLRGVEHVYYFNEMVPTLDEFHQDKWSVPDYLNEIESADYVVLITDSNAVSAVYYEAGYALAKEIPAIYFVGPNGKIPHLMHQCSVVYAQQARHHTFTELEHVPELLRRLMPVLLKERPSKGLLRNGDSRTTRLSAEA